MFTMCVCAVQGMVLTVVPRLWLALAEQTAIFALAAEPLAAIMASSCMSALVSLCMLVFFCWLVGLAWHGKCVCVCVCVCMHALESLCACSSHLVLM